MSMDSESSSIKKPLAKVEKETLTVMDKDKGEDAEGTITSLEEYRKGVEEMQLEVTRTFANFEARLEPKISGLAQAVEKTKKETLEAIKSMSAEFQARRDSEMRESAGSTKAGRKC